MNDDVANDNPTLSREEAERALAEMVRDPELASGARVQAVRLALERIDAAEAAKPGGVPGEDPLDELDRIANPKISALLTAHPDTGDGWAST